MFLSMLDSQGFLTRFRGESRAMPIPPAELAIKSTEYESKIGIWIVLNFNF